MPEREKVIKGLTELKKYLPSTMWESINDALSLLKEQEAKPVYLYGKADWYELVCICPDCKAEWMSDESETHYCPNCGRLVKWDDEAKVPELSAQQE